MVIGSGKKKYLPFSEAKLPHSARLITQSGKPRPNLNYPRQPSSTPSRNTTNVATAPSLNRSGRPLTLSPTGQRHVLTLINRKPSITFNEIRRSVGVALSDADELRKGYLPLWTPEQSNSASAHSSTGFVW
jgi:hypothetical protein